MNITDTTHKKFQLDRIALFSDAVFAIAITLLIIEIKVPEIDQKNFNDHHILEVLNHHYVAKFAGVIVSFFVIGAYWIQHHKLFGYVTDYSPKLLWANLFFLLSIVIMPFSSGFFSEYYVTPLKTPLIFYVLNICFTGLMNVRLWQIVSRHSNQLSNGLENQKVVRFNQVRALVAPFTFVLGVAYAFLISVPDAYLAPIFIPLFSYLTNSYYRKKHPDLFRK